MVMSSPSFGKSTVRLPAVYVLGISLTNIIGSDRPLPRNQRRGAIIILGMLAVARRHIVTERVETLLKVGLGPLGKVGRFFTPAEVMLISIFRLILPWRGILVLRFRG